MTVTCAECPLRRESLFRPLSEAEMRFVAGARGEQVVVEAGETILAPGEQSEVFYTLFDGWALRHRTLKRGVRQITDFLLPGDSIGLHAAVEGWAWHGVQALTAVRLCPIRIDRFVAVFAAQPDLVQGLLRTLLLTAEAHDRRLLRLGRQRPTQRLAHLMLELRQRLLARGAPAAEPFAFPLTYQHMMDALGVSRAQLARSLGEMRDRGWILLAEARLSVLAPGPMAEFCDYENEADAAQRTLI